MRLLARQCVLLSVIGCSISGQSTLVLASGSDSHSAGQQQVNPSQPADRRPPVQPPADSNRGRSTPQPTIRPSLQTLRDRAWQILDRACSTENSGHRAAATRVLGLIPHNAGARRLAEKALADEKPEVRIAAASTLGDLKARSSIPTLRKALDDKDPAVALAAAQALDNMHDESAYTVYYEILTGNRKTGKGLIASEVSVLKDPKKIAQMGVQEGVGFIPFGGIGWEAVKAISKDDSSPVRAASARMLADDPDPTTTRALADAITDKSWLVRAAALEALAKRGDRSALDTVALSMSDEKSVVRYTAAAAVIRLSALKESARDSSAGRKLSQNRE
jgi:HEAT repeat protein